MANCNCHDPSFIALIVYLLVMVVFSPLLNWELLERQEKSLFVLIFSFEYSFIQHMFTRCSLCPGYYNDCGYRGGYAKVLALKELTSAGRPVVFQASVDKYFLALRKHIEGLQ